MGGPRLGVGEVATERGLAICPRGNQAESSTAQGSTIAEEAGDRRAALVFEGLGRHREPRVVAEQGDDAVHVAALHGGGEAADQLLLAARPGRRRELTVTRWKPALERGSGALQGALDRGFARLEHLRDLRRSQTEHLAWHRHRTLARWQ